MVKLKLTFLSTFLLLVLAACSTQKLSESFSGQNNLTSPPAKFVKPEVEKNYYEQSIKRLNDEGLNAVDSIDFLKLRCSTCKENIPYFNIQMEEKLSAAFEDQNFTETIEVADEILIKNFVNIRAHVLKGYALNQLSKDGTFDAVIAAQLCNSILSSGDGTSPETAFYVISVEEEYQLLKFLQLYFTSQQTILHNEKTYDVLLCKNQEGNKFSIYFDFLTLPLAYSSED